VLIARPSRGLWIHDTYKNAINQNISIVYVGLEKHLEDDIIDSDIKWKFVMNNAGKDHEVAYIHQS